MQRILIVDDDTALLEALPEALRLRLDGLAVDTADSGLSALERIRTTDYEAIVCDIKMPGMDGLALLREIRSLWPDTPTLLITGHGEHDLAIQALRGGAYDFIQKPINRDYFLASLSRAVQMRQLSRRVAEQSRSLENYTRSLEQQVEERTAELRRMNEELEALVQQRTEEVRRSERLAVAGRVAAAVAHGIQGPLTVMEDLLHRAIGRVGGPRADLESALAEAGRVRTLLDDFLLLARPVPPRLEPVALEPLLLDAYRALQLRTIGRGVDLRLEFTSSPWVRGDADQLRQVLLNVGSNAIEAMAGTGGQVHFRLGCPDGQADRAEITVRDTGPGIGADDLPHIFEAFYSTRDGASGLGLTIAQRIVQDHQGDLAVGSPPDGGTEVRIALPALDVPRDGRPLGMAGPEGVAAVAPARARKASPRRRAAGGDPVASASRRPPQQAV